MNKTSELIENLSEIIDKLDEMQMQIITIKVKVKRELSFLKLLKNSEEEFTHLKLREGE